MADSFGANRGPKPPNQGGKAPAFVQKPNAFNTGGGASNTSNAGVPVTGPAGGSQEHTSRRNPRGFGGR